ncbi:hypothetical protein J0383_11430 [Flavobacterium endoglycinae]|uniref:Uncharacterized protein n=1 Tax=Flavobacterium endoglycinae TaxID=2816357 RepID=A0ABX7QLY9_9FLAO|nr:hypothetical protein [Flavobacterium endoglycinae]QSW91389.1 hypothetical protein J0383_11430 [Flavobacterium endoglycinae]
MKKITLLLLISSGFMMAQTKPVVTKFGEIVNINPYVNNGLTATNGYIQLGGSLTQPSVLTTTSAFTLAILGLQDGSSSDNILVNDPTTGVLKKTTTASLIANAWRITGNAGISATTNFLGTTDANPIVFKTNGVERMRMLSTGFIGIGTATPTTALEVTAAADPLKLNGLQTGNTATDKIILADNTGVLKTTLTPDALIAPTWKITGNSGTTAGTNFLGTIDNKDLVFKTNSAERIRVNGANSFTGIGLTTNPTYGTTPKYMLDVVDDIHIISGRMNYTSGRFILENQQVDWGGNQGSGMYMLDGQDNGSRREWFFGKPYLPMGSGGLNSFVLKSMQTDALNYQLAQDGTGTSHMYIDGKNNRIGIGTINPATALEITSAANPLKLNGLQAGGASDNIVVADNTGILKTIPRNSVADNLGNHTATMNLNMNNNDINNAKTIYLKSDLQFADKTTSNLNTITLNKNNGIFNITNSNGTTPLSIDETTSKTTITAAQITKGTDGTGVAADQVATALDASGNVIWKSLNQIKGAMVPQFILRSTGTSAYNSDVYSDIPGLSNYDYIPTASGTLILDASLYSIITGGTYAGPGPIMAKTWMVLYINGVSPGGNNSPFAIATNIAPGNPTDYANGGKEWATSSKIYVVIPVTKGTKYTISIRARTVERLKGATTFGTYAGTYNNSGYGVSSSLVGTLVIN